jgi:hypothetical protein
MADMNAKRDEPLILAIVGGIWATNPVTEQPELTLVQWGVRQLPDGSRSLVGWCIENAEGRVSSAIHEFDQESLRGRTASGRVYQLQGPPGHDPDAEYVWARWLRINGYSDWVDVTAEVVKS